MTEHEVPTHVQAEDRVILWFTFPQIVAMTAVCALSYGAYRYSPVGPSEVRMALAVMLALFGMAMVVGKVGGRRLPVVAADLLRFGLGPRRYAGPASDLVRSEPPAPPQVSEKVERSERWRRRRCRSRARRTFRAHGWFGKRRRRRRRDRCRARKDGGDRPRRRWKWLMVAGVAALSAAALAAMSLTAPPPASGQEPEFEDIGLWDIESEIEFEPREPVPGRRLYYEELRVTGDRAHVTLRAATDLEIRVRAFGGLRGRELRFWSAAALDEGGTVSYSLPLAGDEPSLTLSWEDGIGQGGAVTIREEQIPYPLPSVDGELCDLEVTSLGWTPGLVEGTIEADCVSRVDEVVKVWTAVGHDLIGVDAVIESAVTAVIPGQSRSPTADSAWHRAVCRGRDELQSPRGPGRDGPLRGDRGGPRGDAPGADARHGEADPPPGEDRVPRTETVSLWRPGTGRTVSRTVTVTHGDGTTTSHTISAYLSVPGSDGDQERDADDRTRRARACGGGDPGADRAHEDRDAVPLRRASVPTRRSGSWSTPSPSRRCEPAEQRQRVRQSRWRSCPGGAEKARGNGAARRDRTLVHGGRASGRCGDDRAVRPCADGDGLCGRRSCAVFDRVGGFRAHGRGERAARLGSRQGRRDGIGHRSRAGAIGEGRDVRAHECRRHRPVEKENPGVKIPFRIPAARAPRKGREQPGQKAEPPQRQAGRPEAGCHAPPASAEKPPAPLPLLFLLSHLEDDGPVRIDGVKVGVCEVMGLELDGPKLGAFAGR